MTLCAIHSAYSDADFTPVNGVRVSDDIAAHMPDGLPSGDTVYGSPFVPYVSDVYPDGYDAGVQVQFTPQGFTAHLQQIWAIMPGKQLTWEKLPTGRYRVFVNTTELELMFARTHITSLQQQIEGTARVSSQPVSAPGLMPSGLSS